MIGGEVYLEDFLRDLYCRPSEDLVQRLDTLQNLIGNHEYGVLYVPSMFNEFVLANFLDNNSLSDEKIRELLNSEKQISVKREMLNGKQKQHVSMIVEHISRLNENTGLNMARIPNAFYAVGEMILYGQRIFNSHQKCRKEDLERCEEALFDISTSIPRVARIYELIDYRFITPGLAHEEAKLDFLIEGVRFIKEG